MPGERSPVQAEAGIVVVIHVALGMLDSAQIEEIHHLIPQVSGPRSVWLKGDGMNLEAGMALMAR